MFLSSEYRTTLSEKIASDISGIQYKANDEWYDGSIRSKSSGNGVVKIGILISNNESVNIKKIRFISSNKSVIAECNENITKSSGDIFSATFTITITERKESE